MARWTVELIAEGELAELPVDQRARFLHVAEPLEEAGPENVGLPHVRPLEQKLWEMRLRGRDGIGRAIYFAAHGRKLIVVRVFTKKTKTTPRSEIEIALRRMQMEMVDAPQNAGRPQGRLARRRRGA